MSNYETSQTSDLKELINKLRDTQTLSKNEWIRLIDGRTPELAIFTTLKNEGAKTKFISGFATVKNLFFGKTVAMCIQITFADTAVITKSAPVMNRHSARTAWLKEWSLSDIALL